MIASIPPVSQKEITYSVVVPFFNEAGALESLLAEIHETMSRISEPWQAILVDDGSTDETGQKLRRCTTGWPNCQVISLLSNSGQAAALWTGFQACRGNWIITMDGDGQNIPADIVRLLPLTDSYDMVVGIRSVRRDSWVRRLMSRVANTVRAWLLGDQLSDSGCALKIFRREVVKSFIPIRTLYSFMPALAVASGYRVAETTVGHRDRSSGRSNYGLGSMAWRPFFDMLMIWWMTKRRFRMAGTCNAPVPPSS